MAHIIELLDADEKVVSERRREGRAEAYEALDAAVRDAMEDRRVVEVRMREGGHTTTRRAIEHAETPKRVKKDDADGIPAPPPVSNLEMPPPAHPELGPNEEQEPEPEPETPKREGRVSNRAQTVAGREPQDTLPSSRAPEPAPAIVNRPAVQTAKSGQGPQSVPLKTAKTSTQTQVPKKEPKKK